jgi:hypothetical protein
MIDSVVDSAGSFGRTARTGMRRGRRLGPGRGRDGRGEHGHRGHRWTKAGVARVRAAYTIHAPRTVAIQSGEVSVKQAAAELGILADAVYNWLRNGQVPARRGPSGRWCIPWDANTRAVYRRKVAHSVRLKPHQPIDHT